MKRYKKYKLIQFSFPFLFIIGLLLIIYGLNDIKTTKLEYNEDNFVKYNVYLKKNEFFDTPYLGENRTYIASLIDYIDVNFRYKINFNNTINGISKYKYIAQVSANKKDSSGYYWKKEYDLSEEKKLPIENNSSILINDNIKVKYNLYNDILNKFKKEYGVNTDGQLKIMMKVTNDLSLEEIKDPINLNAELSLSVPLLEQSLEVSINKDADNENDTLEMKEKSKSIIYPILKISGTIIVLSSIIGFILMTKKRIRYKSEHYYNLTLEKILKNYDSIIANTNNIPEMNGLKRIEINSFEELLDVYNEVRMPINYYQNSTKDKSTFIIINDDIVWIYKLVKRKKMKRADNNEKEEIKTSK